MNGMRKTWIVDDDHLVRSYLKMLPSWERAGFTIAADVRDGEEALKVLDHPEVELLVTDLSMPLMDGIELIRRIRQTNRKLYIIVLSCHDDFLHVKEAMKEGADEYVLKNTLDEESLYELLVSTEKKIRERENLSRSMNGESAQVQQDFKKKYMFFNKVLAGCMSDQERQRERQEAKILGTYQNSAVISMYLQEWDLGEEELLFQMEEYCREFLGRLTAELKFCGESGQELLEVIYLGRGTFCCFLDLSDIHKSSQMHQRLTAVATSCYKICRMEEKSYQIGVSNICMGEDSIRQAYQQARAIMKFSFYEPQEIAYYDAAKKAGKQIPKEARLLLELAEQYRRMGDGDNFLRDAKKVCESFRREATESRLVLQWLKMLEERLGIVKGEYQLHHMEEVERRLQELFEQLKLGTDGELLSKDLSRPVRIAVDYILQHFREDVGLSDAAEAAGVNAAYLSFLFGQEMGVGFSGFLLNQRVECAAKLLRETSWKVRDVALAAGFQDYHYFSKAFKKIKGESPAQYRKNNI